MGELDWQYSVFSKLTAFGLYEIMALRQLVFVVEQKCPFLDADGYDLSAKHLIGRRDGEMLAAALSSATPRDAESKIPLYNSRNGNRGLLLAVGGQEGAL